MVRKERHVVCAHSAPILRPVVHCTGRSAWALHGPGLAGGSVSPWGTGATSQLLSEGSNASLQVGGGEAEDKLGTPFENPDQALPDTNVTLDFSA